MSIFECRKCLPTNVPDDWTVEKKSEGATYMRETNPLSGANRFRSIKMTINDVKGIALHVTTEKGFCHHCKTTLIEYEGQCSKCKRLNLDW